MDLVTVGRRSRGALRTLSIFKPPALRDRPKIPLTSEQQRVADKGSYRNFHFGAGEVRDRYVRYIPVTPRPADKFDAAKHGSLLRAAKLEALWASP